jgi:hypothetical protein
METTNTETRPCALLCHLFPAAPEGCTDTPCDICGRVIAPKCDVCKKHRGEVTDGLVWYCRPCTEDADRALSEAAARACEEPDSCTGCDAAADAFARAERELEVA